MPPLISVIDAKQELLTPKMVTDVALVASQVQFCKPQKSVGDVLCLQVPSAPNVILVLELTQEFAAQTVVAVSRLEPLTMSGVVGAGAPPPSSPPPPPQPDSDRCTARIKMTKRLFRIPDAPY